MKSTIRTLRLRIRELIAASARGEEVVIRFRGELAVRLIDGGSAARLRPKSRSRNPVFGIWADRDEDVERQVRAFRS